MSRTGVLHVDGLAVEVTVRRVKCMNVRVHPPHGDVRLSVPPRTSQRSVVRFVRESRAWIEQHRARILDEARAAREGRVGVEQPVSVSLVGAEGEVWSRFGRPWILTVEQDPGRPRVRLRPDDRLEVRVPDRSDRRAVLAALERWQRRELRAGATAMLDPWAVRMGVSYRFLGLRRMTTRWGTCVPSKGRIWLNLALVSRPPALLEYVVVHELAHLLEPSHGGAFQELMDRYLPDWRDRRRALDAR